MKGRRFTLLAVAAAAALGAAQPAHAMPPLLAAIATIALPAAGFPLVTAVIGTLQIGHLIFIGTMAYGAYKAHEARADARRAYNRSLTDRNVSLSGGEVPWQIIYGEAVVAPAFAAILTSGPKDEYKHVVTVWAAHESEACTDVLLNGESIGPLDADGWVTTGKWAKTETEGVTSSVTLDGSGQATLPHAPLEVFEAQYFLGGDSGFDYAAPTWTAGNPVISIPGWGGRTVQVSYTRATSNTRVRVRHFTGSVDQVADPVLMALLPSEWTSSDRLRGLTYSVWTFDLREPELQTMPRMSARWKGKKLYDYRTATTAWSANNALATADFLRAEYGKNCTAGQLNTASVIASANACDETLPEFSDAPRYTCNGAFRTDTDPDETLRHLLNSMAGSATFSGTWRINAGVYTAPVMDLGDADNAGPIESMPAPSGQEVFNGLRGKFFNPEKYDVLTDYPPYQNAAFKTEDNGQDLWGDLALPFTNQAWRAHNLARIVVERSRGEQITFPAKRKALKLRPGQRVRLTNSYLGMTNAVFRVVRKEWQPAQAHVLLHLQQDDASFWDTVDAPAALPPPADNNPDPFFVAPVTGLTVATGDAVAQRAADGTVLSRVRVTVDASDDALVTSNGALQVEYRLPEETVWSRAPEAPGSATQMYLQGLQDGRVYLVQARWRNGLGALSDWRVTSVLTVGDETPPAAASGLTYEAVIGGMRVKMARPTAVDYAETEVRQGASWAAGALVWLGNADNFVWNPPTNGSYTLWVVHRDRSGNESTPTSLATTYTAISVGGDPGGNSAQVRLYYRNDTLSAPALPSVTLTYTFATAALSGGSLAGWSQTVPASSGGRYLWTTLANAYSTGATDTVAPGEWQTPQIEAQDGLDGEGTFINDGSFEAPAAGTPWTLATGASIASGDGWHGSQYLSVQDTSGTVPSGSPPVGAVMATNRRFVAVRGETYRVALAVKKGPSAPNGVLQAGILWRNGAGTVVNRTTVGALGADTSWQQFSTTVVTPIDAVTGEAFVSVDFQTAGEWRVDAFVIEAQGQDGAAGAAARLLRLMASSQVFQVSPLGVASPTAITLTAQLQNQTGTATWSVVAGTATLTGSGNSRTLTYANMTSETVTVQATLSGLTDQITIAKVRAGVSALTPVLSNALHALPAAADGTVSSYAESGTTIEVLEGSIARTFGTTLAPGIFVVGTPVVSPPGAITVGARSGSGTAVCTVADHSAAAAGQDVMVITYPVTVMRADGSTLTLNLEQTITKSKQGAAGAAGANAALLTLLATGQAFTFSASGTPAPATQTISFTAVVQNLAGTAAFSCELFDATGASLGAATLGGSGNTRTLAHTAFGSAAYAVVQATLLGYTDQVRVVRVADGRNGITGWLTNEAHTVATAPDGTGGNYSGAGGTFKVLDGTADVTTSAAFSVVSSSGITGLSIGASTGIYSLTGMSAESGEAVLRAVYGGVTLERRYSISQARQAQQSLLDFEEYLDVAGYVYSNVA